jgi:hypothetical protein
MLQRAQTPRSTRPSSLTRPTSAALLCGGGRVCGMWHLAGSHRHSSATSHSSYLTRSMALILDPLTGRNHPFSLHLSLSAAVQAACLASSCMNLTERRLLQPGTVANPRSPAAGDLGKPARCANLRLELYAKRDLSGRALAEALWLRVRLWNERGPRLRVDSK